MTAATKAAVQSISVATRAAGAVAPPIIIPQKSMAPIAIKGTASLRSWGMTVVRSARLTLGINDSNNVAPLARR